MGDENRHLSDPLPNPHAATYAPFAQPRALDPNIDYSDEGMRKRSFEGNWPSERFKPSVSKMIAAGFVYAGPGDFVECYTGCGIKLHKWGKEDDPKEEHKEYQKKKKILCDLYPDVKEKDFYVPDPNQPESA